MSGYNKGGLVKPTLEEVKEYFKYAKIVKDSSGDTIDISSIDACINDYGNGYYAENYKNKCVRLWYNNSLVQKGYAEIIEYKNKPMKKVIRLDQPKEESKKPIELIDVYTENGLERDRAMLKETDEVIYIGKCLINKCDMFSVINGNGGISFWRGKLNDGVY